MGFASQDKRSGSPRATRPGFRSTSCHRDKHARNDHDGVDGHRPGCERRHGIVLDDGHPRHIDFVAARYPELRVLAARPAYPWQDEMIAVLLHKANVFYELHGWGPGSFPTISRKISVAVFPTG
jgi:predicted TIM-barrel fold metal-dependent hydrolase